MADQPAQALFSVFISQAGSRLQAILGERDVRELFDAVHRRGAPVSVWITYDNGRSTGILLVPRRGGVVLNMEPAARLPVHPTSGAYLDAAGVDALTKLQPPQQPKWIEPKDQRAGTVVVPPWADQPDDPGLGHTLEGLRDTLGRMLDDEPPGSPLPRPPVPPRDAPPPPPLPAGAHGAADPTNGG